MEKFIIFHGIFNNLHDYTIYIDNKIILEIRIHGNADNWVPFWPLPIQEKLKFLDFPKKTIKSLV